MTYYFNLGALFLPPTGIELGYEILGTGKTWLDSSNSTFDTSVYGGGLQVFVARTGYKVGIDVSFEQVFHLDVRQLRTDTDSIWTENYTYGHALVVGELPLGGYLFAQAGIGLFLDPWTYRYQFTSFRFHSLDKDEFETGVDTDIGLLFAVGSYIPLAREMRFIVQLRAEILFDWGLSIPVSLVGGVVFNT